MCQHYSGHKVKQLYAAIQNPQVIYNHLPNAVAHGYKIPRSIQRWPFWLLPGKYKFDGGLALFLRYEKKLSETELSQQFPLRLILCRIPKCFSSFL